ncbi:hypothetical protein PIB30_072735 [Stylosanthes scabra]|uniref:Uncharacterized protein n=1 Tax=Stylosanthes scabra TaxID=79078 RepID=A0ABU6XMP2_9FABA|nr:hypothetical protein [Stylosanthes scabra]
MRRLHQVLLRQSPSRHYSRTSLHLIAGAPPHQIMLRQWSSPFILLLKPCSTSSVLRGPTPASAAARNSLLDLFVIDDGDNKKRPNLNLDADLRFETTVKEREKATEERWERFDRHCRDRSFCKRLREGVGVSDGEGILEIRLRLVQARDWKTGNQYCVF